VKGKRKAQKILPFWKDGIFRIYARLPFYFKNQLLTDSHIASLTSFYSEAIAGNYPSVGIINDLNQAKFPGSINLSPVVIKRLPVALHKVSAYLKMKKAMTKSPLVVLKRSSVILKTPSVVVKSLSAALKTPSAVVKTLSVALKTPSVVVKTVTLSVMK
jgi:hypothetical protein